MKLEDEIQQTKFRSDLQKTVVNILFTANWITRRYHEELIKWDLTLQQYNILRILKGQYPNSSTVKLLRERMIDKMSDTSRLVDKLVAKGFVNKTNNPVDRRNSDITISEKGIKTVDEIEVLFIQVDNNFNVLNKEEIKQLSNLLDRFRDY